MVLRPALRLTVALLVAELLAAPLPAARAASEAEAQTAVAEEPAADAASPDKAGEAPDLEKMHKQLCTLIETAARDNGLPVGFFTRLIWKESRFRHDAVSPRGAQGIAQFMPGTAADRGLDDPFDVEMAIPASARLLFDLERRFGNLGLAAAAYNAGETRVHNWLSEVGGLPLETRDYVLSITGVPAETWADSDAAPKLPKNAAKETDCLALAALLRGPGAALAPGIATTRAPWGVQIAGGFSRAKVIGAYQRLKARHAAIIADRAPMIVSGRMPGRGTRAFYRARVPAATRAEAEKLCAALQRAGTACIVLKT
jgi:hypothetical protein